MMTMASARKEDLHARAMKRYDIADKADRDNRTEGYNDLRFLAGDQWPEDARMEREAEGRPCLTINRLGQFVKQVTGDVRKSRPGMKVVPVDDQSDPKTAEVINGLVRHIESTSDGKAAYAAGADQQVAAGIGHWRVISRYASDDSFDQDLAIVPVRDGLGVLWDPASTMPTREDAMYCFVPAELSKEAFEERFPDAAETDVPNTDEGSGAGMWSTYDKVRVAEYWFKEPTKKKLARFEDGSTADVTEIPPEMLALMPVRQVVERDAYKVRRCLISGSQVLEGPEDWPGKYIPIVACIGETVELSDQTVRFGLIRYAKDAQRLYNYWRSAMTEQVALQPKAPFIVTEKNIEKYAEMWRSANRKNYPALVYNADPANGGAAPQRATPPLASSGLTEAAAMASEDMKATTGIYDASLGARSNETSGRAILAREAQGDTSTFVYFDNFSRAINHTARIIIDLIPHFYDAERIVRIVGDDGKEENVRVNAPGMGEDGFPAILHDLTVGKYDVVPEAGPSYATKRQEAAQIAREILPGTPPQYVPAIFRWLLRNLDMQDEELARELEAATPQPPQPNPEAQALQMRGAAAEVAKTEAEADRASADAEAKRASAKKSMADTAGTVLGMVQPPAMTAGWPQEEPAAFPPY